MPVPCQQSPLEFPDAELMAVRLLPAEFARAVGVSKQSVSRWLRNGTVTAGADGRLDPTRAMRQLLRNGDSGRIRARLVRQAIADMADLRSQAGRAALLEQQLADATARLVYLDGYARELDLASELLPDILVAAVSEIRATPGDQLRQMFADLIDHALLSAGDALGTAIDFAASDSSAANDKEREGGG